MLVPISYFFLVKRRIQQADLHSWFRWNYQLASIADTTLNYIQGTMKYSQGQSAKMIAWCNIRLRITLDPVAMCFHGKLRLSYQTQVIIHIKNEQASIFGGFATFVQGSMQNTSFWIYSNERFNVSYSLFQTMFWSFYRNLCIILNVS